MLEWLVATFATLACLVSLFSIGFPIWLAAPVSIIPLLICLIEQRRIHRLTQGVVLLACPGLPWKLKNQASETQIATLEHFWHHFFGVTLALKIENGPHNRTKNVRIMVWRCRLSCETYRRLCVMVNWQVHQLQKKQSLESV